jgi:exopolysaccharide production protein ExoQ
MPPTVALFLWFVLLLALLCFDRVKEPKTSAALWVPVIWMFFLGSRSPSEWLHGNFTGGAAGAAQALEEGDPLNRTISLVLLLLCIGILVSRSFRWGDFFARNLTLTAYLLFALVSVLWSDFPLPAFKKWFRDLGNYFMVLVVLSDPRPVEALSTLLRRLSYLLIPLSVLLVKYYPALGRFYDPWTGAAIISGAATGKNLLGLLALLGGVFFSWDTVTHWADRRDPRTRRTILVDVAFIAMSLWLLNVAQCVTCNVCFVMSLLVIAGAHSKAFQRRPGFLKVLIPAAFLLYLVLAFGCGMSGSLAQSIGKDPTLSGRTEIWEIVLSQHTNPLLGAGYESFWLGPRLLRIWEAGMGTLNEAHNGYLEVYLNLGLIGLFLLVLFLISCYRLICRRLRPFSSLASLTLALFTITLFFCVTEAGFRSSLMWLMLLLAGLSVPGVDRETVSETGASHNVETAEELVSPFRSDEPENAITQPSPWGQRSAF